MIAADTKWPSLVARMKQEAARTLENNKQRGTAIITLNVIMNANGEPLVWVVSNGKRIEPSKDALHIIEGLVKGF